MAGRCQSEANKRPSEFQTAYVAADVKLLSYLVFRGFFFHFRATASNS